MISNAITDYRKLLSGSVADEAIEKLLLGTERYQLKFGRRPICSVLRPFFITSESYNCIKNASSLIISAIDKVAQAVVDDPKLRAELDLSSEEEQMIAIEPGFSVPDASGRLDAFLNPEGGFKFIEYNADSPGGLLYGDVLSEIFMEMEVVRLFSRTYPLRRIPIRPLLLETLLKSYRQWINYSSYSLPRIAIVDWKEVKTRAEFEICREYFESHGCPTVIVDPDQLEYRGGYLRAGNFQIDLVYKRVVTSELIARLRMDHPLIRAARERAVCVVNSFRVQLLCKKAIFALLDDPEYHHLYNREELDAISRHIPWTRQLREGNTTYRGRRIDLLEFVASRRNQLVLKPSGDYGGRGVRLGWECTAAEWEAAIVAALGASFIIQEKAGLLTEQFPVVVNNSLSYEDRFVDFNPYTWAGEHVEGAGVRLSQSALLNVTAGSGSATPMLIIER